MNQKRREEFLSCLRIFLFIVRIEFMLDVTHTLFCLVFFDLCGSAVVAMPEHEGMNRQTDRQALQT